MRCRSAISRSSFSISTLRVSFFMVPRRQNSDCRTYRAFTRQNLNALSLSGTGLQLHRIVSAQAANFPHQFLIRAHALVGAQRSDRALGRNQIEGHGARAWLVGEEFL